MPICSIFPVALRQHKYSGQYLAESATFTNDSAYSYACCIDTMFPVSHYFFVQSWNVFPFLQVCRHYDSSTPTSRVTLFEGGPWTCHAIMTQNGKKIYQVKWYKNDSEFYSYAPGRKERTFKVPGVTVNVSIKCHPSNFLNGVRSYVRRVDSFKPIMFYFLHTGFIICCCFFLSGLVITCFRYDLGVSLEIMSSFAKIRTMIANILLVFCNFTG